MKNTEENQPFEMFTLACEELGCTQRELMQALKMSTGLLGTWRPYGIPPHHFKKIEHVLENPYLVEKMKILPNREDFEPLREEIAAAGIPIAEIARRIGISATSLYTYGSIGIPRTRAKQVRNALAEVTGKPVKPAERKPQMNGHDAVADDERHKFVVHGVLKDPAQWDMFCAMVEMFCEEGTTIVEV